MPKVVGKDLEEARTELEALGFGISLVREGDRQQAEEYDHLAVDRSGSVRAGRHDD